MKSFWTNLSNKQLLTKLYQFFHKIRFYWFVFKNLSLYKAVKYSNDIQAYALSIASTRIRIHFKLPFSGKNNATDRKLAEIVDDFFNYPKQVPVSDSEINCEEILTWLENDQQSKEVRKMYLRVSYWQENLMLEIMKSRKMKTEGENRASTISSTYQSIYGEHLEIPSSNDFANIRSEFRKKFKAENNVFRESRAKLIDFSLKKLTLFLPWISFLFIFAGYIHTRHIYGQFGIEVDQFFSLNDYLATTIKEIAYALSGIVGIFLGIMYLYRNEWAWELYKRRILRLYELISFLLLFLVLYGLHRGSISPESLYVSPVIVSCSMVMISSRLTFYLASKYFKNSTKVSIISLVLIGFFSCLALSIYAKIQSIKSGRPGMEFEIKAGTREFTQENFTFIGGNSRYIFLRAEDGSVEIIPIESTERIKILTDAESSRTEHDNGQSITNSDGKSESRIAE